MTLRLSLLTALLVVPAVGCRDSRGETPAVPDTTVLAERESRLATSRSKSDTTSGTPLARWMLPPMLAEISGLTLTRDQRLLAHNDESGRIFEVDYRRGVVVKAFTLGPQLPRDDFEAITTAGERIFLLASLGVVYEFKEGEPGSQVRYTRNDTGLGQDCEFEGLAFDSTANALVLACKNVLTKGLKDYVVLYRYQLDSTSDQRVAQIRIPFERAIGANPWKRFTPSDLSVDPVSGDYVVISAQEKGLLRITSAGEVVWSRPLPPGHEMAEGLAITRDSLLIVSDEAASKALPAAITIYRWR